MDKQQLFTFVLTDERALPPRKAHDSDAGYDLVLIDVFKKMMPECGRGLLSRLAAWLTSAFTSDVVLYETGVAVQPPDGFYFELVPRSSIVKSGYMLANSVGIIDSSYTGTIKVPLRKCCWWAKDLELPSRLVQLVLRPQIEALGLRVAEFNQTVRGSGGFGSTGC